MFVNMRGNPVSRDEYEKLLQRVIALEEKLLQYDSIALKNGKRFALRPQHTSYT